MESNTEVALSNVAGHSQRLVVRLKKEWIQELRTARRKQNRPCLWKALRRLIPARSYAKLAILRLLISSTHVAFPLLVWLFLQNLEIPSLLNYKWTWCHLAGISVVLFVRALCVRKWILLSDRLNVHLKVATIGLLYNKVLSLTRQSLEKIPSSKMIALVSDDVQKLDLLIRSLVKLLCVPFEITGLLYIMWSVIGWQGVVGSGTFLVVIVYINALSGPCSSSHLKKTNITRKRIALIEEVVLGIRTIKINAWEAVFAERIKALRRKEIAPLYLRGFIVSSCMALSFVSASVAVLLASSLLTFTGTRLESSAAFTFLVALHVMKFSLLDNFNESMKILAESKLALEKIQSVLEHVTPFFTVENHNRKRSPHSTQDNTSEEKDSLRSYQAECSLSSNHKSAKTNLGMDPQQSHEDISSLLTSDAGDSPRVTITELTCSWTPEDSERNTLDNISLDASASQLVVITGSKGAGKSSLLMAILAELPTVQGSIRSTGSIAFIPQKPWIISGSLRENIILDRPFREQKYHTILRACALRKVFLTFPNEDMTVVGNNGVVLNDSVRARLSMARALYSDADIYLMDDPLSKLDETIREHIYRVCICGMLANRLRFLVTPETRFLTAAEHVIALRRGSVIYQGSYKDFARSTGDFPDDVLKVEEEQMCQTSKETGEKAIKGSHKNPVINSGCGNDSVDVYLFSEEGRTDAGDSMMMWRHLLWRYCRAGQPLCVIFLLLLLFIFAQVCIIAPSWWLQRMVTMSREQQMQPQTLKIHGSLVSAALVVTTGAACCCCYATVRSSQRLHERMTEAILKAPMQFYDTNHPEQIKTAFGRNVNHMDQNIPNHFVGTVQMCLFAVSSLIVPVLVNYWLLLAFLPLCACLMYYVRCYMQSFPETKRREATKRRSLCSHFCETVTGLEVIRSSKTEKRFIGQFYRYLEEYTLAFRLLLYESVWLQTRLDLLWAMFITAVACGSVLTGTSSALAGLSITFAVESLRAMQNGLSHVSEAQSLMRSVQRVMTYGELAEEPGYANGTKPPESWPNEGALEVRNMSFSRSDGGSELLSDVSFAVIGGEKVGVVGREGSGVSSLSAALFRMPDPKGGVYIDGIDIGTLSLQAARKSMALVSKYVVLVPRSLRDTLDPVKEFTDDHIWAALDGVQLKTAIEGLPGKLDCDWTDPEVNLTGTQLELICLARALLSKTRLIIIEEDPCDVSVTSNALVHDVVTSRFKTCTVLSVSRRPDLNCKFDKLLVMKQGRVVEYGKQDARHAEYGLQDFALKPNAACASN